jgi:hypothetical protein
MQATTPQDLSDNDLTQDLSDNDRSDKIAPRPEASGNGALRPEAIVEPAVWIPDFPGDEPDMEYTDWRDLLFVYSGYGGTRYGDPRTSG